MNFKCPSGREHPLAPYAIIPLPPAMGLVACSFPVLGCVLPIPALWNGEDWLCSQRLVSKVRTILFGTAALRPELMFLFLHFSVA